jgi:hypothetical protein
MDLQMNRLLNRRSKALLLAGLLLSSCDLFDTDEPPAPQVFYEAPIERGPMPPPKAPPPRVVRRAPATTADLPATPTLEPPALAVPGTSAPSIAALAPERSADTPPSPPVVAVVPESGGVSVAPVASAVPVTPGSVVIAPPRIAESGEENGEPRPDRLLGLTEASLVRWIGQPQEQRDRAPARVWRYSGVGCTLDVFLFFDVVGRQFRALSYEITPNDNGDEQLNRCLRPVFAGRGNPTSETASRTR